MKVIGHTSSGKPVYAAFQFHKGFADWTAHDHDSAAAVHREVARTDIKTNASMHENSAALHEDEARQIYELVQKLGLAPRGSAAKNTRRQHATQKTGTGHKSSAQLDREIAEVLGGKPGARSSKAHARVKAQPLRVAYRLQLTASEMRAVEFARGRYAWPDMLADHVTEGGLVAFTEPQMWQWTDDVDSDTEGGHSPFPLAAGAFAEKLQRFYDERI